MAKTNALNAKSLPSPITQVPQDVLELVFLATIPTDGAWPEVHETPPVAQICTTWRSIALELPRLWARFRYRIDRPAVDPTMFTDLALDAPTTRSIERRPVWSAEEQIEYIALWFSRSNPLPVSFCIQAPDFLSPSNKQWRGVLDKVLGEWGTRIHVLRYDGAAMDVLNTITLPLVQHLEIAVESCYLSPDMEEGGPIASQSFPALSSVLYSLRYNNPFLFPVRWGNLTSIDTGDSPIGMSVFVWKYLIRCCGRLERGRFLVTSLPIQMRGLEWIPAEVLFRTRGPAERCTLVELQSLTLIFEHSPSLWSLLQGLELPKLESLDLEYMVDPSRPILASWRDAFGGISASMKHLTINCGVIQDVELLRAALEELPGLEALQIKMQKDPRIFDILTPDTSSVPSLTRLRRLTLWLWPLSTEEEGRFAEMVRLRGEVLKETAGPQVRFTVKTHVESSASVDELSADFDNLETP